MPVTQQTYQSVSLEDPEGQWELHRGRLREKPPMSVSHNWTLRALNRQLVAQLDPAEFDVSPNSGRLRKLDETVYIPDVMVLSVATIRRLAAYPDVLEVYDAPAPLVVEIWSPSTGEYDVDTKLPEYMKRGDLEIWRLHPFERTLTDWRRQPDGSYEETVHRGGKVRLAAIPSVEIDLDELFL